MFASLDLINLIKNLFLIILISEFETNQRFN